ncbi:uncharacterized protein A4U43_C03F17670 [Asparagus officinalis]|uniref:AP2/ERF domain-containing protein n=1 Tax=Asparagus officinalis TaxID=4686 RepID=A0A5P1FBG8_ASPOF|nr:uncharacterized protein A4U43_C03F17670 [Asparagus officinalis]
MPTALTLSKLSICSAHGNDIDGPSTTAMSMASTPPNSSIYSVLISDTAGPNYSTILPPAILATDIEKDNKERTGIEERLYLRLIKQDGVSIKLRSSALRGIASILSSEGNDFEPRILNSKGNSFRVLVDPKKKKAALAYDKAAFKLRGDFARLNFPDLRRNGSHYGPELHSSVNAKLSAICENIDNGPKKGKQENAIEEPKSEEASSSEEVEEVGGGSSEVQRRSAAGGEELG